jgi:hypothetical protein
MLGGDSALIVPCNHPVLEQVCEIAARKVKCLITVIFSPVSRNAFAFKMIGKGDRPELSRE